MLGNDISKGLQETFARRGITPTAEGLQSVLNVSKCNKLGEAVWAKMTLVGETDQSKALDAVCEYADVLCKKWHGIGTMSDRIFKRYYSSHPYPSKDPGSPEGRGGEGRGEGRDGEGQPEEQDQQGPSPSPSPDRDQSGGQGGGDGQSGGDGQDGDQDRGGAGDQGDGQGDDPEEGEGESGGEGESEDQEEGEGDGQDGDQGENEGQGRQDGEGQEQEQRQEQSEDGEEQEGPAPPEEEEEEEEYEFDDDWTPPKNFSKIVEAVRMGMNVAMYGPAGCGKTDIATHVGMVLDLPYYITTAPQMPYDLTGFVDATGTYTETAFSVPFMRGGIAVLDELDRSSPEAVIAVNAPIANGTMFVPKLGQFTKNKDCIFMATLNTAGLGADMEYVTANQLDASTRDRFIWFPVDYDERVELKVTNNDRALVSFAQDWRQACKQAGITNALFSYRVLKDFKRIAENPKFGVMDAIDSTLLKGGVPKSSCLTIMRYLKRNNRYHKAFKLFVDQMPEE